ncbi:hypothetical protein KC959_03440, partial [Candidatus Saccharibacteria bacterium]|nr:hypothetical protein [Candidatus Saccharibacteria bacterium]
MAYPQKFHIPNKWRLEQKGDALFIHGGSDTRFELDLDDNPDSVFPSLGTKPYVVDDLSVVDQVLHEQLLTAGITQPKLSTKNRVKIRVIP